MAEWQEAPLGSVYAFSSGLSKPRSAFGSGYPFLTFKDVFYNHFVPSELTELVESTMEERASRSIERGDVFLTRTSETVDELAMSCVALRTHQDATFNGFTKRLRPKPGASIIPEFAAYYFRSPRFRRDVTAMASLSTRASLNNEMLERLSIPLPPIDEQVSISGVLKSLDDKIGLLRRMNETLEAMAGTFFRSWFVDFDPGRAIAEGRDPGLPKPIADLFPDRFKASELGDIPAGWSTESLSASADIISGGTPKTSVADYWNGGIPWFSVADAPSPSDVWVVDTERKISELGVEYSSTQILPVGTTIISARGTVGQIALVGLPMAMNQSCYGLRGKVGAKGFFTYFTTRDLVSILRQRAHGSVFDTITRDTLAAVTVVVPPSRLVEAFEDHVSPIMERMRTGLFESRSLAALRDTLLPRLISGELRSLEAARMLEAAPV